MSSDDGKRKWQDDEELIRADYSDGEMSKTKYWYISETEKKDKPKYY